MPAGFPVWVLPLKSVAAMRPRRSTHETFPDLVPTKLIVLFSRRPEATIFRTRHVQNPNAFFYPQQNDPRTAGDGG